MLITSSIWQFYLFTAIKRQLYQALLQHFMIYLRSSESRSNLLYLLFDQHTTEQIKILKLFRAFRKRFWYMLCCCYAQVASIHWIRDFMANILKLFYITFEFCGNKRSP